ncbi:hypothetical protein J5X84_04155 [Streptosporangiaceae bacterium NEAU-GS5]|nr:hypothetical protein [Streptosporangiaceae bacterium NEAU-GS5]
MTGEGAILRAKIDLIRPALTLASGMIWATPDPVGAYVRYLTAMYPITRSAVPLMRFARRACRRHPADPLSRPLARFLTRHMREERGHDRWIRADVAALGGDPAGLDETLPIAPITALIGGQYALIGGVHPVAVLGCFAILESDPPGDQLLDHIRGFTQAPQPGTAQPASAQPAAAQPAAAQRVAAQRLAAQPTAAEGAAAQATAAQAAAAEGAAAQPAAGLAGLAGHAASDAAHGAEVFDLLDRLTLDARQRAAVGFSALYTARQAIALFTTLADLPRPRTEISVVPTTAGAGLSDAEAALLTDIDDALDGRLDVMAHSVGVVGGLFL